MNDTYTERTSTADNRETAALQSTAHLERLSVLFDQGWEHLLKQQWTRLLEIQEIQLELMKELAERKPH